MFTGSRARDRARPSGERGAGAVEYAGLIVLAALILGALYATGITGKITPAVGTALCKILHEDGCGRQKPVAGDDRPQPGRSRGGDFSAPRPVDPLQVQAVAAKGQPQPNPQPQQPPPPNPNASNWGPSTGHGPGNPGIGKSGDLPRGGDHPYVPPKSGRGKPVKIKGKTAWKDNQGRTWEWDRLHKDHWDVTDKNGDHINVNPDGSEARNPDSKGEPKPSASPSAPKQKGGGKAHSWLPWGIGAAGAGGLLWWGGKVLSPACGPLAPACAIAL